MQAHVVCPINSFGDNAAYCRAEWVVNGVVVSSTDFPPGMSSQLEFDVPENSTVRLDMGTFNSEGASAWTSSGEINVGSAPAQPPTTAPAPTAGSLGSLSVAYWF